MKTIHCTLYIDHKYYQKLNATGKELFIPDGDTGLFYSTFPAEACSSSCLYESIIAYCEVTLIMLNDQYEITEDTSLHCEIFNLEKSKKLFTLLISISYPNQEEVFSDLMLFEILHQTETTYSFKLLGDQTLFSFENITSASHT